MEADDPMSQQQLQEAMYEVEETESIPDYRRGYERLPLQITNLSVLKRFYENDRSRQAVLTTNRRSRVVIDEQFQIDSLDPESGPYVPQARSGRGMDNPVEPLDRGVTGRP